MVDLSVKALLSAMQGAKNVYPKEFIALFRGKEIANELIIPPFSEYGDDYSSFSPFHLPPMDIQGSFHSHPNGAGKPSQEDLLFFSKMGKFHVVAYPPFSLNSFKAYAKSGEQIEVNLVEA